MENRSDSELIQAYRAGNSQSMSVLITRHYQAVNIFIRRMIGNPDIAIDLCQDVFLKMMNDLPMYREQDQFKSWLFRIARNTTIDWLRKRKVRMNYTDSMLDTRSQEMGFTDINSESPYQTLVDKDAQLLLLSVLEKLPHRQREVYLLREHSGLSFKEIADITGCSVNTALGRMHYAVCHIRKHLKDHLGAEVNDVL